MIFRFEIQTARLITFSPNIGYKSHYDLYLSKLDRSYNARLMSSGVCFSVYSIEPATLDGECSKSMMFNKHLWLKLPYRRSGSWLHRTSMFNMCDNYSCSMDLNKYVNIFAR